jgi:hypothetical protein
MVGCPGQLGCSPPLQQHYLPNTSPSASLSREVECGSTRSARVQYSSSPTLPANHSRHLPASPSQGADGGSSRPAAGLLASRMSTDFITLYEHCTLSGLRARVSINHQADYQEIMVFCRIPTFSKAAATNLSKCRRLRCILSSSPSGHHCQSSTTTTTSTSADTTTATATTTTTTSTTTTTASTATVSTTYSIIVTVLTTR